MSDLYESDLYDPATDELTDEDMRILFGQPGEPPAGADVPRPEDEWLDTLISSAVRAQQTLGNLADDELIQMLPVLRSITAQATARELAVTQELLRRRKPGKWDSGAEKATGITREAVQEVALALTLTQYSAQAQAQLAIDLQDKLPETFAQMNAGNLDPARVKVIAEANSLTDPESARKIDRLIADQAAGMTTGKLRAELRKLEVKVDPKSAEKRRERAERRACLRLYPDSDFTAALCGQCLPADLAAAAHARVCAIAAAWKAAGAKGPVGLLQAKVFLGLLLGTLDMIGPPGPSGPVDGPGPESGTDPKSGPAGGHEEPEGDGSDFDEETSETESAPWPTAPGTAAAAAPGCAKLPQGFDVKPGRLNLTAAWRTLLGTGSEPGQLTRIGPITPAQARRLAEAAAKDPTVAWTVVVTDDDGHAIGVTTLRKKNSTAAPGMIGEVTVAIPARLAAEFVRGEMGSVVKDPKLAEVARAASNVRTPADGCDHAMQVPGYRIPGSIRRWVAARDRTCFSPICRMPASRCDQDHTIPWHKGGRSCPCNLGAGCRVHHQMKQLPGWELTQKRPGYFILRTRAGLTYTKTPDPYPV
jgi:hypothetical protein